MPNTRVYKYGMQRDVHGLHKLGTIGDLDRFCTRVVRTSLQKAVNAIVLFSLHNADYDSLAAAQLMHHVRLTRAEVGNRKGGA